MGTEKSNPPSGQDSRQTLIRSFVFVILDQLPHERSKTIIRKVGVKEIDNVLARGIVATDPNATITFAEHVLGRKPSQYLSFSDSPLASPTNVRNRALGIPILVDSRKLKRSGVQIFSTEEIVADLRKYAEKNPDARFQANVAIRAITNVEGEVLIKGKVAENLLRKPGPAHKRYIAQAEKTVEGYDVHRNVARTEHEIASLKSSYRNLSATGRIFRLTNVIGVVLSVGDVAYAGHQSIKKSSGKPVVAESIRQAGGWGLGWTGVKLGCRVGALFAIETGPGMFAACAIGGILGGVGGYFFADWIADDIHKNEPGVPWMETNNW